MYNFLKLNTIVKIIRTATRLTPWYHIKIHFNAIIYNS